MSRRDQAHPDSRRKPKARCRKKTGGTTHYETLEARQMLAVAKVSLKSGLLSILSNNTNTSVELSYSGSKVVVSDLSSGKSWKYSQTKVQSISFQGGDGNDRFISLASGIRVTARGGGGNDVLQGGSGDDFLYGDWGSDSLLGLAGNDSLFGGADADWISAASGDDRIFGEGGDDRAWGGLGNDLMFGGAGNDQFVGDEGNDRLFGETGNDILWGSDGADLLIGSLGDDQLVGGLGNDQLNGQAGNDRLWGQEGNDTLIGIDGLFAEYLEGGTGRDVIWRDAAFGNADTAWGNTAEDKVHDVSRFDNNADLTLDGDRIADPALHGNFVYKSFSGKLFSSTGPQATDAIQGSLADCYLIAGLSAMAMDTPWTLQANMVDFNDGTYGVCLDNDYFRVDGDLPVASASSVTPAFAKFGAEGSLWVAIAEKAFAHHRSLDNSYRAIEFGSQVEIYQAMGSLSTDDYGFNVFSNATQLANQLFALWNNYRAVCVNFNGPRPTNTFGVVMGHAYTVYSFQRNSAGQVTGVTLRNPWGFDGSSRDSNPNDGLVTLTPDELFALRSVGSITAARFA